MWPFGGGKDWNVVGIMFEKSDTYTINGNRVKGRTAESVKTRVRVHDRTILWVVYDQKGGILDQGMGGGQHHVPQEVIKKLQKVLHTNSSIREILKMLETGQTVKAARKLIWDGYPRKERKADE